LNFLKTSLIDKFFVVVFSLPLIQTRTLHSKSGHSQNPIPKNIPLEELFKPSGVERGPLQKETSP
jgi:hypothetical protein